MNEEKVKKIDLLLNYFDRLNVAQNSGYKVGIETKEVIDALRYELGLTEAYQSVPQNISINIESVNCNDKSSADDFLKGVESLIQKGKFKI